MPQFLRLVPFLLWALCSTGAATGAVPAGVTVGPSAQGITEYRLPNGLTVLLFPEPSRPGVTINVTYKVGARHGTYGETGMAHLLEHMLFKGTARHPDITAELRARGAQHNAGTSVDYTSYFQHLPATGDNLRWALELEADRMVNARIAKEDLDTEMTVVRNEFERHENDPIGVLMARLRSTAIAWLSAGKPVIGNRSDIEHVPAENLRAFYKTWYQPDNAVVLVAGRFDADQALAWIDEYFGALPRPQRTLPRYWTTEPQQDGERTVTLRRNGDLRAVVVMYRTAPYRHPDALALAGATAVLGSGPSSRLHKALVETGKAVSAGGFTQAGEDASIAAFFAVLKPDAPLEPARDALIAAVESFAEAPPTAEEVDRFHQETGNQARRLLADTQTLGLALSSPIAAGDWRLVFHRFDRLQQLPAAAMQQAAGSYFRRDARNVGMFIPETAPQRATIPEAPSAAALLADFRDRPALADGEAFDTSPANIDRRTRRLSIGGLKVALLPKKTRGEVVRVTFDLDWGDERSLFGKRTVSGMTQSMLLRGTTRFSRQQLADERRRLEMTGGIYSFQTTRGKLADALRLSAHILRDPAFPEPEFARLKTEMLTGIAAARREPGALAGDALTRRFNHYPRGDWRHRPTLEESPALIEAVTLDDVRAFHRDYYGAGKGELAIVGDFDADAIVPVIEAMFSGWRSGMPFKRIVPAFHEVAAAVDSIDTPDKSGAVLQARMPVRLNRFDADYPALFAAGMIIGRDPLDSRLGRRLRQQEGLTYSVGAHLQAPTFGDAGEFDVNGSMAPANLARFEASLRAELAAVRKDGVTAAELERFKAGTLEEMAQRRSNDSYLAGRWRMLLDRDATFAEEQELETALRALTLAQVNDAIRRRLDFDRLVVVRAGDLTKKAD